MRARLAATALLACLAMPAPADAAETVSTFTLRFESGENDALQELESLSMTVARGWQQLEPGPSWDAEKYGPYELVRRGADYSVKSPLPGEATVTVTISPTAPVPSESVSAQALAASLLAVIDADVARRLDAWRGRALSAPRASADAAHERIELARSAADTHRKRWGDVATEHRMAADRLHEAASDLARTRIDLAVAARRLETARAAAERAAEAAEIRREAEAIERKLEAGEWSDPKEADELRRTIVKLRDALAEAERRSPPLPDARRAAFDLEVEMVGLEARKSALEPEIVALRERVVELVGAAAEARVIEAELSAARTAKNSKDEQLRELETKLSKAAVVVVTPPTMGVLRER